MKTFTALSFLICFSTLVWASPEESKEGSDSAKEKALLGVATSFVSSSLHDHLDLDQGFGIEVHEVVAETPAATAGVNRHDILIRLDDQLLISPEHLSLLIGIHQPGDTVTLHCIRKGETKAIEVTLGTLDPEMWPHQFQPNRRSSLPNDPRTFGNWQEQMRKQQEHWQKWSEKQDAESQSHEDSENPERGKRYSENSGFPITVFGKEGMIKIDNPEGSLTMETEGGETQIAIRNAGDEVVYNGVFDTEAGIESLPEEAQDQLKRMNLKNLPRLPFPQKPPRNISGPMPPAPEPGVL